MQESASTTALPLAMLIASLGHSSTHDSQPLHFSLSTFAGIDFTLSKIFPLPIIGVGMLQNYNNFTT
jgi:hypothetical protein